MNVKLNTSDTEQVSFLKKNLRPFYTEEILKWQYLRWDCNSCLYLTNLDGKYIASQGMIPINLVCNGNIKLSAKSESSFMLPEYRGRGLFEALYEYTIKKSEEDNTELIWGFTALSKVWRNILKFDVYDGLISETKFQLNFKTAFLSAFKDNPRIGNKLKQATKAFIASLKTNKIPKSLDAYQAKELNLQENETTKEIYHLFKLWNDKNDDQICINIDGEYLKWRIVDNPLVTYKLIGVYNNQQLVGYGIINQTNSTNYLVEFIVPSSNELENCLFCLLQQLKSKNDRSHVIYWASNRNPYCIKIHSILNKLGSISYPNSGLLTSRNYLCIN